MKPHHLLKLAVHTVEKMRCTQQKDSHQEVDTPEAPVCNRTCLGKTGTEAVVVDQTFHHKIIVVGEITHQISDDLNILMKDSGEETVLLMQDVVNLEQTAKVVEEITPQI